MSLPVQLPLSVQLRDDATFASFYRGGNEALVNLLDMDRADMDCEQFIYLYGPHGAGCSHLLQAACHQVDRQKGRSIYLPMKELVDHSPKLLEGIERLQLVCLDDIGKRRCSICLTVYAILTPVFWWQRTMLPRRWAFICPIWCHAWDGDWFSRYTR